MKARVLVYLLFIVEAGCQSHRQGTLGSSHGALTASGFAENYQEEVLVDLAQVTAVADVHVTATCTKVGMGNVSGPQYCDASGWPYETTIHDVSVTIHPTHMHLAYYDY